MPLAFLGVMPTTKLQTAGINAMSSVLPIGAGIRVEHHDKTFETCGSVVCLWAVADGLANTSRRQWKWQRIYTTR